MSDRNIEYLLDKYRIKQKGEYWTPEMEREHTKKRRTDEYLAIADNVSDRLSLVGSQKDEVKHMIRTIQIGDLHRTADIYTIITALCVYVKKCYSKNSFNWEKYQVCRENGLTEKILITVLCNLVSHYRKKSSLGV